MPWINVIPFEAATGLLKQQYDKTLKRAGLIWSIVSTMNQNPPVSQASMVL